MIAVLLLPVLNSLFWPLFGERYILRLGFRLAAIEVFLLRVCDTTCLLD